MSGDDTKNTQGLRRYAATLNAYIHSTLSFLTAMGISSVIHTSTYNTQTVILY